MEEQIQYITPTYTGPKYPGGYRFGNHSSGYTQINLTRKPNFIHRFFMKVLLGLYWFDEK